MLVDRRVLLAGLAAGGLVTGHRAFANDAPAKDAAAYIGIWSGRLAGDVIVRLDIESEHQASLTALVLGGHDIPATTMTVTAAGLHLDFGAASGVYDGKLDGDTLRGTWSPHGQAPVPLDFSRGDPFQAAHPSA